MTSIHPQYYPLLIALVSLIVLPLLAMLWRHYSTMWKDNRQAKLDAAIAEKLNGYATTEELEMHLDTLQKQQDAHHVQNQELLHSIKDDGLRREGMILGQLKQAQDENRANDTKQEAAMGELHRRVDRVLELTGERRR